MFQSSDRDETHIFGLLEVYSTRIMPNLDFGLAIPPPLKRHQAEWANGALIVAGGSREKSSEKCTMNENDEFECVDISPILYNYAYGVSFLVETSYCV